MSPQTGALYEVREEERLRADCYALLARLLAAPPTAAILRSVSGLEGSDSILGRGLQPLTAAARATTPEAVEDEYFQLFIGVGRGEVVPYASFHLAGFLYDRPLAKLRIDMSKLGIARADAVHEPEDHIAALCEIMSGMITGAFGEPADLATQQHFFDAYIVPWAGKFFEELEAAESAAFFMPVGTIGKLFMEIETQAFRMAA